MIWTLVGCAGYVMVWVGVAIITAARWLDRYPNDNHVEAGGYGIVLGLIWPLVALAWLVGVAGEKQRANQ